MKKLLAILYLVPFALTSPSAWGQSEEEAPQPPPPELLQVSRAASAIRIDGVLDEPAWSDALAIDVRFEWSPGDNAVPPVKTQCLVTYDNNNLYVAFEAFDPEPDKIRAHLMDRDDIGSFVQDDHVGFTVDTFNDERRGFQFRVNPVAVQVDALFNEFNQQEDFSWDVIWSAQSRITAQGYLVEIAVPLNQIRFPRGTDVMTWGFEAFRSYPRNFRYRISSKFTSRGVDCTLCQENKITGFQGIKPGLNLELDPTMTAQRTDELDAFPDGSLAQGDEESDLGLSLRWGLTPNLSFDAALNPDFSQVEADTAQLDVNTRFDLFFPEKRPFFLEGADFFETPLRAVFTRTIFDPNWGVKLTGKEGRNAVGVVVAEDDFNAFTVPFNQFSRGVSINEETQNAMVRYRRDIGARSALGVLATARDGDEYSNQLYGVDGFFRFGTSDSLSLQYLHSETRYPSQIAENLGQPLDQFGDDAFTLVYNHLTTNWIGQVRYEDLGEGFRADSGFIRRVDLKTSEAQVLRRFWGGKDAAYTLLSVGVRGLRSENQSGQLTDETFELTGFYAGPKQSQLEVNYSTNREFFAGQIFDLDRTQARFQIRPSGSVAFTLFVRDGDSIDFTNVRKGDEFLYAPGVEFKLGQHVNLQLDYINQALDVPGGKLFDASLTQMRLVYQFNTRIFARLITQFTEIDQNPEQFSVPVETELEELFSQLLFSYKLNPRTVLFAGYTETRSGLADVNLTQTDRTLFLKVGYAFLF